MVEVRGDSPERNTCNATPRRAGTCVSHIKRTVMQGESNYTLINAGRAAIINMVRVAVRTLRQSLGELHRKGSVITIGAGNTHTRAILFPTASRCSQSEIVSHKL